MFIYLVRTEDNGLPKCVVVLSHPISLGELIYHRAWRMPSDPVYEQQTLGM